MHNLNLQYYKTIAIEPYQTLVDEYGNIHPYSSIALNFLIQNNFHLILWSIKGTEYCNKLISDSMKNNIEIRKKPKEFEKKSDIYFCIDTDKSFCLNCNRFIILPNFVYGVSKTFFLENAIKNYFKLVDYININLNEV